MLKDDDKTLQIWPPKLVPENLINEIASLRHFFTTEAFFGIFFGRFFSGLWSSLGASWAALAFLEGLMGGLWTQKH